MKTLIKNIFSSLFRNRITKYEDASEFLEPTKLKLWDISAADALNLSRGDYNRTYKQAESAFKRYHNSIFEKIQDASRRKFRGISLDETSPEGILIEKNIEGMHDKLLSLGYNIELPHEYNSLIQITWDRERLSHPILVP